MRVPISKQLCWIVTLCLICPIGGCAGSGLLQLTGFDIPTAGVKNPVVQVLGLWQPADGEGVDNRPSRGFSGQMFFFTARNQVPARVNGTVRIYVFDDQGTPEENVKPIHQFDFPAESWQLHMRASKLGPAYYVFIPYTRKGNHQAQCSLRIRYTPKQGPPVYSEMTNILLPGPQSESAKLRAVEPAKTAEPGAAQGADERLQKVLPEIQAAAKTNASQKRTQIEHANSSEPESAQGRTAPIQLTAAERKRIALEYLASQSGADTGSAATQRPRPARLRRARDPVDEEADVDSEPVAAPRRLRRASPPRHVLDEEASDEAARNLSGEAEPVPLPRLDDYENQRAAPRNPLRTADSEDAVAPPVPASRAKKWIDDDDQAAAQTQSRSAFRQVSYTDDSDDTLPPSPPIQKKSRRHKQMPVESETVPPASAADGSKRMDTFTIPLPSVGAILRDG